MARVYSYTGRWIGFADGNVDIGLRRGANPWRLPGYRRVGFADFAQAALERHPHKVFENIFNKNALAQLIMAESRPPNNRLKLPECGNMLPQSARGAPGGM